jgi:hypothetical protein
MNHLPHNHLPHNHLPHNHLPHNHLPHNHLPHEFATDEFGRYSAECRRMAGLVRNAKGPAASVTTTGIGARSTDSLARIWSRHVIPAMRAQKLTAGLAFR